MRKQYLIHLLDKLFLNGIKNGAIFLRIIFDLAANKTSLSTIVKVYNPPYTDSKDVHNYISNNIEKWIEDVITIR
jgi:hypothetical protein